MRLGLLVLLGGVLLAGCTESEDSAKSFVASVKAQQSNEIPKLPESSDIIQEVYSAHRRKSPFYIADTASNKSVEKASATQKPAVIEEVSPSPESAKALKPRPDAGRREEFLERYPLATLRMVGHLQKSRQEWALLSDADGLIHHVKVGNYLGKHSGKIEKISEKKIHIREIIQDEQGNWLDHMVEIDLEEDKER